MLSQPRKINTGARMGIYLDILGNEQMVDNILST